MDHTFTAKIRQWLDTAPEERNLEEGALMVLQLNGNRIMYANIMRNPAKFAANIEYELRKFHDFRVRDLTHEQVVAMQKKVDEIEEKHNLSERETPEDPVSAPSRLGMRPDHNSLPDELKAIPEKNREIMRRMQQLQLRLRTLTLTDHPCPDSERFPFLKEIIALDKEYGDNWERYDTYGR